MAKAAMIPGEPINLDPDDRIRWVLYGMPGSGKTRTASTAAGWGKALVLNAKGNQVSTKDYTHRPDIIDVWKLEDLNDPYTWITRGQPEDDPLVDEFELEPPYSVLIVDQITELQRMYFDRVMSIEHLLPADIPIKREWSHFGRVLQSMIKLARLYFNPAIPMHVIMVAQEREADPDSGRLMGPLLEGQSQVEIPSYGNIVSRIQHFSQLDRGIAKLAEKEAKAINEDLPQFITFFEPTWKFQAKDQFGRLPSYAYDILFEDMIRYIYE